MFVFVLDHERDSVVDIGVAKLVHNQDFFILKLLIPDIVVEHLLRFVDLGRLHGADGSARIVFARIDVKLGIERHGHIFVFQISFVR